MLFALDAMGGDHAPKEPCLGAIRACRENKDLSIVLIGAADQIEPLLADVESSVRSRLHIVHTDEVIGMGDSPSVSIRKKRKASLCIGMQMVHSKEADGCISAGNTGAIVAGGVLLVGRIDGIDRPGLAVPLPALEKPSLLLDVGATVRCKAINLYQFAHMGSIYMRTLAGVDNPSVAVLSNGEEDSKGDEACSGARELLLKSTLNFKGYIEGKDVPYGKTDVVVCDGYTGNALIKFGEGIGEVIYGMMKAEIDKSILAKMGVALMYPALKRVAARFDYEKQGGSPLLGVDGVIVKAHGRSKAPAIATALTVAHNFALHKGVERIREELSKGGI